jgi:hypothetical protein
MDKAELEKLVAERREAVSRPQWLGRKESGFDLRAFFEERRRPSKPDAQRQALFQQAIKAAAQDPAAYKAAERQFVNEEAAAATAAHYAVAPETPEDEAARQKLLADIQLAKTNYSAYVQQRTAETKARLEAENAQ